MDSLALAKNLIEKSRNIFIIPSQEICGDTLGAGLALFYALKKIGKNANFLIEKAPSRYRFLLNSGLNLLRNFTIAIDTSDKEILEMQYEKNEKDIKIHLSLNGSGIKNSDVSFVNSEPASGPNQKPDLSITLGAKSLQDLGEIFTNHPSFFYESPILNIDNQLANEHFGEVNFIEIKSCSLSEIITEVIKSIDETLFDKEVATCLLTGIISASSNFQNPRIRPQLFETVSYLFEKGADHQKIIQHLFKTKSFAQIKLLGLILEKLNFDEKKELYSACLDESDFKTTSSVPSDLTSVIEDLKFNFWASVFPSPNLLILWRSHLSPPVVKGIFYSSKEDLIGKILENFEGGSKGNGALFLIREGDLNSAYRKVLNILS